ncbi:MAG: YczE/YyaS/YitT family protein [Saccharofermentanales bacterium]
MVQNKADQKPQTTAAVKTRRFVVYRDFMLLFAVVIVAAGVTLMARSDFGISAVSSVPYVFSLHFTQLSFGTWSFISYITVISVTMLLTRNFELFYLVSLFISVLSGIFNDVFKYLWSFLPLSLSLRVVYFLIGWSMLTLGIACFIKSELPPGPYELFVSELARLKGVPVARGKTLLDLAGVTISTIFLIFVLRRLAGIGPGTVLAALFNGTIAGFILKHMDKRLEMKSLIFKKIGKPGAD